MEDAEAGECEDDYPCPGCEDDFDLPSLCSHLEEEHPELLEEEVVRIFTFGRRCE